MIKEKIRPILQFGRRIQRGIQKKFYGENYMENIFTNFYESNHWKDDSSVSGTGSNLEQTAVIRNKLPELIKKYNINSMLDLPCGDFFWMKEVELGIRYIGADIVEGLIENNQKKYANGNRSFIKVDVTRDKLPKVDSIMCRDIFVHFSYQDIRMALKNIEKSGIIYLLVTNFPETKRNSNIVTGQWRPLNFLQEPFNFSDPLYVINEEATQDEGRYKDKCLALWRLSDLSL